MGRSPRIIPPLVNVPSADMPSEDKLAAEIIERLHLDVLEAKDNLLTAKVCQAEQANKTRRDDHELNVGELAKL